MKEGRERNGGLYLQYQAAGEEAVIYRLHGTLPVVKVPEYIGEYRVTAIGAYCFSDRKHVPEGVLFYPEEGMGGFRKENLGETTHELAGEYIEQVVLPDSVRRIDNAAFFGCRNLSSLEIGNGAMSIGSDVFNNCSQFKKLRVREMASEPSGIRHILSRVSWELEVEFQDAMLLYPEYFEIYDTIAPAHIFGLNIEGEGFRARQCFREESVDFAGYDAIFGKACAEESVATLGRMALNRLISPVQLSESSHVAYEKFVKEHVGEILCHCVRMRERERMEFICKNQYAGAEDIECAVSEAARANWSEGAASLMEWKHRFYENGKKNRYEF